MRPITATDLMNPEVLTVRDDLSVSELAAFLIDNEITGAPVADAAGQLIGVVSLTDVAEVAAGETPPALYNPSSNPAFFVRDWEDGLSDEDLRSFHIEEQGLTVADIMTPEVFTVEEDARVSEIAGMMLDGHVHRLIVVREGKPVGIISTSDLLGLLVDED